MNNFGQQLKKIRKKRKLRQVDLSEALGLAQTTIANYEQGTRFPDEQTLINIADFFHISADYLLGRQNMEYRGNPASLEMDFPFSKDNKVFMNSLLNNEIKKPQEYIKGRLSKGIPLKKIYTETIQAVLYHIGTLWQNGILDVYQEHLVSEGVKRIMSDIMSNQPGNPSGPVFLGFSVIGELHEIGIMMITDIFRLEGWNAVYLGTNLPTNSILNSIRKYRPRIIGISAALQFHVEIVENLIRLLREEFNKNEVSVMVGGMAFNTDSDLWKKTGADYYAKNAVDAAEYAKSLKKVI